MELLIRNGANLNTGISKAFPGKVVLRGAVDPKILAQVVQMDGETPVELVVLIDPSEAHRLGASMVFTAGLAGEH